MYEIYSRQKKIADALGVIIKSSTKRFKKIAVYTKEGKKICDIGDIRYFDYCQYKERYGKKYADQRKDAYWSRHRNDINSGCGFYSARILWS